MDGMTPRHSPDNRDVGYNTARPATAPSDNTSPTRTQAVTLARYPSPELPGDSRQLYIARTSSANTASPLSNGINTTSLHAPFGVELSPGASRSSLFATSSRRYECDSPFAPTWTTPLDPTAEPLTGFPGRSIAGEVRDVYPGPIMRADPRVLSSTGQTFAPREYSRPPACEFFLPSSSLAQPSTLRSNLLAESFAACHNDGASQIPNQNWPGQEAAEEAAGTNREERRGSTSSASSIDPLAPAFVPSCSAVIIPPIGAPAPTSLTAPVGVSTFAPLPVQEPEGLTSPFTDIRPIPGFSRSSTQFPAQLAVAALFDDYPGPVSAGTSFPPSGQASFPRTGACSSTGSSGYADNLALFNDVRTYPVRPGRSNSFAGQTPTPASLGQAQPTSLDDHHSVPTAAGTSPASAAPFPFVDYLAAPIPSGNASSGNALLSSPGTSTSACTQPGLFADPRRPACSAASTSFASQASGAVPPGFFAPIAASSSLGAPAPPILSPDETGTSADEIYKGHIARHGLTVRPASHSTATNEFAAAREWFDRLSVGERSLSTNRSFLIHAFQQAERNAMANFGLDDYEAAIIKHDNVPATRGVPPFHSYLLWRSNGKYTRLIPADMLPPLLGIPATQTENDGCWICYPPNAPAKNGLWIYEQPVIPISQSESSAGTRPPQANNEDLQFATNYFDPTPKARIDAILAKAPASSPGGNNGGTDGESTGAPTRPKRAKIYCDKWVHEGTCAFAQQGCKYKHEMPQDKATQHTLGLFHGLPAWWKRQQAGLARQATRERTSVSRGPTPAVGEAAPAHRRTGTTDAESATSSPPAPPAPRQRIPGCGTSASWRTGSRPIGPAARFSSPFGPIGPPRVAPTPEAHHSLGVFQEGEENEEE